ncbi:helix-turn-helix transcriptional regulator [Rhizobium sp. 007]|uniref:helix-turn-helix transcriptional regulator n=1 Tax=Rhizobium sp. 007 TaxID=2785056 RepID=UPI00189092E1|nr:helix-turn-helix transcriptional regulator [Rhizobium sp. 007]QPB21746.1 helix-turn-helix transcriptional regulator [Rhizobium sp. 007]
MITPSQSRAARALVEWSREQLAEVSRVALRTIVDFERGARAPREVTILAIERAFSDAGIAFLDGDYSGSGGPGVRLVAPAGKSIDADDTQMVQYREYLVNDAPPGAGG